MEVSIPAHRTSLECGATVLDHDGACYYTETRFCTNWVRISAK